MAGLANILKEADIFYNFPMNQLELVCDLFQVQVFNIGEVIFWEGSHCSDLYIIAQGEVEILVNPSLVTPHMDRQLAPVTIATLRQGQCFGEIALVDEGFRSATARAAQNATRLLVVSGAALLALCETKPEIGFHLMHNLAIELALKIRSTDLLVREQLLYMRPQR